MLSLIYMKYTKNIWIALGIIVLVIIVVVIFRKPNQQQTSDSPIKIGAILSLSGMASQDGESIKNGMELARKELLAKGITVDINYQDDATDPKKTVSGIQFLNSWGAQAIIGPTWSFLGDAGGPVLDQNKIVGFQPADTSEYVTKGAYSFFGAIKLSQEESPLKKFVQDNSIKTIAFIGNEGGWGVTNENIVKQVASETGAQVVLVDVIPYGKEVDSISTLLIKIKSLNPDLIVGSIDDDQGISLLLQRIQEYGMKSQVVAATTSFGRVIHSSDTLKKIKVPIYTLLPQASPAFTSKYEAEYGKAPSAYADTAYDGLNLLVNGIMKKGNTELKDYLKTHTYQGVSRTYSFDDNNDVIGGNWVMEKTN